MLVLCILFGCPCVFSSQPVVPTPHFNAKGLWGGKGSQWQRRLGWNLRDSSPSLPSHLPPPSRLLFVTGSDGCLPGCVASLSVFSCSDPLAGWLRKMCFRCPVVLGIEGIHPSPF